MTSSPIIAPSILAADFGNLKNEIIEVEKCGADWLHIDVMDGSFVPPITFGDNVVKLAKQSCNLFLDVHLMINNPGQQIDSFCAAGSDRIIVHQEACPHLHRVLGKIKDKGVSNGVAINPGTKLDLIEPVLDIVDLVLIMTVNPGWGGQSFIESNLSKIESLSKLIAQRNLSTLIEVDGGVNKETASRCVNAGAKALVAGSYIFGQNDYKAAIESLRGP